MFFKCKQQTTLWKVMNWLMLFATGVQSQTDFARLKSTVVALYISDERNRSDAVTNNDVSMTADDSTTSATETPVDAVTYYEGGFRVRIMYLPIGALGIVGNSLVLLAIVSSKKMRRRVSNLLILNQALIDCFSSILLMFMRFYRAQTMGMSDSAFADLICRLWDTNMFIWGSFFASTLNIVLLSVERYFAILHPFFYQRAFTKRKVCMLAAGVWVVGLAFEGSHVIPTSRFQDGECFIQWFYPDVATRTAVALLIVSCQFFIPVIIMTVLYTKIVICLQRGIDFKPADGEGTHSVNDSVSGKVVKSQTDAKRDSIFDTARRNMTKTLVTVSVVFFLCWIGNEVYYCMYLLGYPFTWTEPYYHASVVLVFSNCCVNPVIYVLQYQDFRSSLLAVWRRCHCNPSEGSTGQGMVSITSLATSTSHVQSTM